MIKLLRMRQIALVGMMMALAGVAHANEPKKIISGIAPDTTRAAGMMRPNAPVIGRGAVKVKLSAVQAQPTTGNRDTPTSLKFKQYVLNVENVRTKTGLVSNGTSDCVFQVWEGRIIPAPFSEYIRNYAYMCPY